MFYQWENTAQCVQGLQLGGGTAGTQTSVCPSAWPMLWHNPFGDRDDSDDFAKNISLLEIIWIFYFIKFYYNCNLFHCEFRALYTSFFPIKQFLCFYFLFVECKITRVPGTGSWFPSSLGIHRTLLSHSCHGYFHQARHKAFLSHREFGIRCCPRGLWTSVDNRSEGGSVKLCFESHQGVWGRWQASES